MPATDRKHRGAVLFASVLLLFLSVLPLYGQSGAATSHVLDLDGKDGYVELPPNIFNDLDESTVEAWVKWRSFPTKEWARFFS